MNSETSTKSDSLRDDPISADLGPGWAVLGCLSAGGVGIFRALTIESANGVFLCLMASVIAFYVVYHMYHHKS